MFLGANRSLGNDSDNTAHLRSAGRICRIVNRAWCTFASAIIILSLGTDPNSPIWPWFSLPVFAAIVVRTFWIGIDVVGDSFRFRRMFWTVRVQASPELVFSHAQFTSMVTRGGRSWFLWMLVMTKDSKAKPFEFTAAFREECRELAKALQCVNARILEEGRQG